MMTYTIGWCLALGVGVYLGWWANGVVSEWQINHALSLLSDDEKIAIYKAWRKAGKAL